MSRTPSVDRLQVVLGDAGLPGAALTWSIGSCSLAHLLHFFLGAVLRRVGHRVAAIAVGLHLEDVRALAAAAMLDGALAGGADGAHVHAVDLLARDAEGRRAWRAVLGGRARSTLVPMAYLLFSMT
jgi:hypothetical protein